MLEQRLASELRSADPELRDAAATVQGWLKEHFGGSIGDREAVRLLQELSPEKVRKASLFTQVDSVDS